MIWLLLGLGLARAESCENFVDPLRHQVKFCLDRVFEHSSHDAVEPHLARLDGAVVDWAARLLGPLSPGHRRNVIDVWCSARATPSSSPGWTLPAGFWDLSSGVVVYSAYGVDLYVDRALFGSEQIRAVLVHEITHLIRNLGDSRRIWFGGPKALKNDRRKFNIYRNEIPAFREEYRYLRQVYTSDDIERLDRMGERAFARRLRDVFSRTEPAYVKTRVKAYRGDQFRARRRRAWLGPGFGYAIGAGVAGTAILTYGVGTAIDALAAYFGP